MPPPSFCAPTCAPERSGEYEEKRSNGVLE
jgi:hypothetical protein